MQERRKLDEKKERGEEGIERRDWDFKWHKNWAEYQVLFVDAAVLSSSLKTLWDAKHGKGGLEFTRAVGVVSNQHPSSKASCAWLCNFRWLPLPSTPPLPPAIPHPNPPSIPFFAIGMMVIVCKSMTSRMITCSDSSRWQAITSRYKIWTHHFLCSPSLFLHYKLTPVSACWWGGIMQFCGPVVQHPKRP